jgi:hypothetical protein
MIDYVNTSQNVTKAERFDNWMESLAKWQRVLIFVAFAVVGTFVALVMVLVLLWLTFDFLMLWSYDVGHKLDHYFGFISDDCRGMYRNCFITKN